MSVLSVRSAATAKKRPPSLRTPERSSVSSQSLRYLLLIDSIPHFSEKVKLVQAVGRNPVGGELHPMGLAGRPPNTELPQLRGGRFGGGQVASRVGRAAPGRPNAPRCPCGLLSHARVSPSRSCAAPRAGRRCTTVLRRPKSRRPTCSHRLPVPRRAAGRTGPAASLRRKANWRTCSTVMRRRAHRAKESAPNSPIARACSSWTAGTCGRV